MPIQVLAPDVVAKIAAGEVIERPASVVKELVENALDAGATRIDVELRGGGLQMVRVTDDGSGIPSADLSLAFRRHATSKVSGLSDLDRLTTLGFRGEALASIAAVSRVRAVSRPAEAGIGQYVILEAGAVLETGPASTPGGSSITVRNLFYNLPSRRKHLRRPATEATHVAYLLGQYALGWPNVRFSLTADGHTCLQTGGGGWPEVLVAFHGPEAARSMIPVGLPESKALEALPAPAVHGYVSPPNLSRAHRRDQSFFVNGRWVRSALLTQALEAAYRTLLPAGRHPLAVLRLTLDPTEIDVNIHPAKLEIRFLHERTVQRVVNEVVGAALSERLAIPALVSYGGDPLPGMQRRLQLFETRGEWVLPGDAESLPAGARGLPALRVLGQLNQSFIVAEGPGGLFLIDQHRAHERVLFERLLQPRGSAPPASQALLEGLVLDLSAGQALLLGARLDELADAGFTLEPYGARSFVVRSVPEVLRERPGLLEIVAEAIEQVLRDPQADWRQRMLAEVACRGATRAGQPLSLAEMRDLLLQLQQTRLPTTCPHAAPIIAHLSSTQLERQFGRKWLP